VRKFLVVIERAGPNYSAFSPDLPGCIATGATREEAERNIREAIASHLRGLAEDNLTLPDAEATAEYVVVEDGP
jgi:predicted RNase H-like HicB family nuclease